MQGLCLLGRLRTATGVGCDVVTVMDGAFGEGGGCPVVTSSLNVTCIMVLSLCHVDKVMCLEIWILEIKYPYLQCVILPISDDCSETAQ